MPLTPRFEELVKELNLPEAAWHLSRTNAGTENHAEESVILEGRDRVLKLLYNVDGCITRILAETERELASIEPMEQLLRDKPQGAPYNGDIARRLDLEKVRIQAQLILDGWFNTNQTEGTPSPQNLFQITRKTDQGDKTGSSVEDISLDRPGEHQGQNEESPELLAA